MELTRVGGVCLAKERERGERDGEDPCTLPSGVPAADNRAGASRTVDQRELAREFEPSANAIRKWIKQAELNDGARSDGLTTSEREELTRLRRENRALRVEREILAKAAAWFATETGSVPSRRSNS
jgi:transposase